MGEVQRDDAARLAVLTSVLNGLPAQVCAWDAELRLRWGNERAESWGGLSAEQAHGRTLGEVLGADVADVIRPYYLAALDGRRVRYERVASDVDRHRRSFIIDVTPMYLDGQVIGVSTLGLEISAIDDAATRIGARSPLLDERDRVGATLDTEVLPALRAVMRDLADVPRGAGAARDPAALEALIGDIDSAVSGIRDTIGDLLRSDPPPAEEIPVVPGPGLVRRSAPVPPAPADAFGVAWTVAHAQALFDSMPASAAWNSRLRNVAINVAGAANFGYEPHQVHGMAYRELMGEAIARRSEPAIRRALRGTASEIVVAFADPQGLRRAGRMRYTPFFGAAGEKLVSAMAVDHDADALDEPLSGVAAAAGLADDRRRIAEDLHDHVIQLLYAAGLSVASLLQRPDRDPHAALGNAVQCVADAILGVHSMAGALTRTDPQETEETVRRIVRRASGALGFEPRIDLVGDPNALPPTIVADLTAVLREALSNAARHAGSTEVNVALVTSRDEAWLRVSDDGVGIGSPVRSSGLANLAARAERHGGRLSVRDQDPRGTVLDWRVPL